MSTLKHMTIDMADPKAALAAYSNTRGVCVEYGHSNWG
jgi:hypothetical protein